VGLIASQYRIEDSARKYLEAQLWPDGPLCPHCRLLGKATQLNRETGIGTHGRKGLYQCRACRKQFTVTVGTIFEDSHIPLHKWLLGIHLICSSQKKVIAVQLQRELKLGSWRSASFMCRRILWAMTQAPVPLLLHVKPTSEMPRPGAHRHKSVWAEVNEELNGPKKQKRSL
jgi:transposase-like protein